MAAMSTNLTEISTSGSSRTYMEDTHSIASPELVLQKSKIPTGNQTVAEISFAVVHGTEDSDGTPLANKVSYEVKCRYPVAGIIADRAAVLVVLRDLVAGDEFGLSIESFEFLA